MIRFLEYSKKEKKLKYYNSTSKKIPVKIDFFEGHTNSFMFTSSIDLESSPDIRYFTYIPGRWKNMRAYFYHRETNELLAPFVFDGDIDIKEFDYENYLTKIQSLNSMGQQAGVNDVLREHFSDRHYENIVDVEEGDVVVDIGFNYGIFSLGALKKGASKIYGFEPNKNIYEKLKYYPRKDIVQIFNLAVSDKYETLTFYEGDNTLGSSVLNNVGDFKESYEVKCINFYDFINKLNISKIDFLKVDCEGTEYEVFESIPDEFFKTIKKIHVEFHNNDGEKIKLLTDKLNRNDFEWQFESGKNEYSNIGLIFAKKKFPKNTKKVALFSSYCDTQEKIDILEKNIKVTKSYGLDVIVISPFNLPENITKECDYFFITKDNPVLDWPEKATYFWITHTVDSKEYYLTSTRPDYGFAGLNQVKQISEIALNLGYEQFYHMIYDLKIDDNVISGFRSDKNFSVYPSKRGETIWAVGLHLMIFDVDNLKKFISEIDREDYVASGSPDAFVWLHNLNKKIGFNIEQTPVEDEIYYYENNNFWNQSPIENLRFFIEKDVEKSSNIKLFFYDEFQPKSIKLTIDNLSNDLTIKGGEIIDLGFNEFDIKNVKIEYESVVYDLTETIKKIKFNTLTKL